MLKLKNMRAPSVIAQLSIQACRDQAEHPTTHPLIFTRQGLPIRGHKENEGNLIQLLQMQSIDSPKLRQWISDGHLSNDSE